MGGPERADPSGGGVALVVGATRRVDVGLSVETQSGVAVLAHRARPCHAEVRVSQKLAKPQLPRRVTRSQLKVPTAAAWVSLARSDGDTSLHEASTISARDFHSNLLVSFGG